MAIFTAGAGLKWVHGCSMKSALIEMIRYYQRTISPRLGTRCLFPQSCSNYAIEAIETYGVGRGIMKAMIRVVSCNPFNYSGRRVLPQGPVA
jgi:putative membrane protein insertion efficiency factor